MKQKWHNKVITGTIYIHKQHTCIYTYANIQQHFLQIQYHYNLRSFNGLYDIKTYSYIQICDWI